MVWGSGWCDGMTVGHGMFFPVVSLILGGTVRQNVVSWLIWGWVKFQGPDGRRQTYLKFGQVREFCPDWSVGTNGPSNHSRGKELELDWSMSGLVICNQGGHPWVLPKSYGKGWFFAVSWFSEHKRRGRFFYHSCFLGSQGSCKIQDCQKKEVVILKRVVGGGHTEKVTFEQRPKPEDIKDIREGTLGRKNSNAKPKELLGLICWRNTKEFSVAGEEWD